MATDGSPDDGNGEPIPGDPDPESGDHAGEGGDEPSDESPGNGGTDLTVRPARSLPRRDGEREHDFAPEEERETGESGESGGWQAWSDLGESGEDAADGADGGGTAEHPHGRRERLVSPAVVATVASLLVPGLGAFYQGETRRGAATVALWLTVVAFIWFVVVPFLAAVFFGMTILVLGAGALAAPLVGVALQYVVHATAAVDAFRLAYPP